MRKLIKKLSHMIAASKRRITCPTCKGQHYIITDWPAYMACPTCKGDGKL